MIVSQRVTYVVLLLAPSVLAQVTNGIEGEGTVNGKATTDEIYLYEMPREVVYDIYENDLDQVDLYSDLLTGKDDLTVDQLINVQESADVDSVKEFVAIDQVEFPTTENSTKPRLANEVTSLKTLATELSDTKVLEADPLKVETPVQKSSFPEEIIQNEILEAGITNYEILDAPMTKTITTSTDDMEITETTTVEIIENTELKTVKSTVPIRIPFNEDIQRLCHSKFQEAGVLKTVPAMIDQYQKTQTIIESLKQKIEDRDPDSKVSTATIKDFNCDSMKFEVSITKTIQEEEIYLNSEKRTNTGVKLSDYFASELNEVFKNTEAEIIKDTIKNDFGPEKKDPTTTELVETTTPLVETTIPAIYDSSFNGDFGEISINNKITALPADFRDQFNALRDRNNTNAALELLSSFSDELIRNGTIKINSNVMMAILEMSESISDEKMSNDQAEELRDQLTKMSSKLSTSPGKLPSVGKEFGVANVNPSDFTGLNGITARTSSEIFDVNWDDNMRDKADKMATITARVLKIKILQNKF